MNGPVNSCLEDGLCVQHSNGTDLHKHKHHLISFKFTGSVPQNSSLSSSYAPANSNTCFLLPLK